jgi:hypothetical protein
MPETAANSDWFIATAFFLLPIQQRIDFKMIDKPERKENEKYDYTYH